MKTLKCENMKKKEKIVEMKKKIVASNEIGLSQLYPDRGRKKDR